MPALPFKPLFENEACLVISKLAGESSEDNQPFHTVHRLDMPVTGCLLLAKTQEAAAFLSAAFKGNEVEKRYWAIVEMFNDIPAEGELVHWVSFNKKANKSFAIPANPPGASSPKEKSEAHKKAILRYRVIGQGEHYLFMEIDLVTGRRHQIRAQLAALGFHIKGDLKYGAKRSEKAGGIRLHAYSLAFPNPGDTGCIPAVTGESIRVQALPPVMDSLWTAFARAANT